MKTLKFKTMSKQQLADTITPVGMYSKIRDKYANSLLLESSDYHSKEESFTFICAEPIVTLKADENTFSYCYKDKVIDSKIIDRDFYSIFQEYSKTIDVDCDAAIKSYNGFYGYVSYNSIQYFETIKLKAKKAASEILTAAQARADQLTGLATVTIAAKASDEGKLFGSVAVGDIADAITEYIEK